MIMIGKECIYCGSTRNLEKEHIKPKSKGGVTIGIACKACNRSKSDDSVLTWFRRIKKNKEYRWSKTKNFQKRKRGNIAAIARKVASEK